MAYGLPQNTIVNHNVPKKLFLEKLNGKTRIREHLTRDVEAIVWHAKLAPSTLKKVEDGKEVHEITAFRVPLKARDVSNDLFAFIDTKLPRYTIFILTFEGCASLLVNYKEPVSGNTENTYRTIETYRTPWMREEELNLTLSGLSMDSIYDNLVRQVAGDAITSINPNLRTAVEETKREAEYKKKAAALENKIKNERQPKRQFELHQQLGRLKADFEKRAEGLHAINL